MEPQVIIPLSEYNELKAFKEKMQEEQFLGKIEVHGPAGPGSYVWRDLHLYGNSDVVQGLKAEIENRDKTISDQLRRLWDLQDKQPKKRWWQR